MTVRMTVTLEYGIAPPSYRLPAATHVGRVRLQVSDLDRSVEFYTKVLGLRLIDHVSNRATLGPQREGAALVELTERKGARTVPRRGLLGLFHFAILLPDRASLGRFLRHLAEIGLPAGMSDHLVSEAIYLQDPDNLGIEVYADRPRHTWPREGRQLRMATEPLDATDLMAAGGEERWDGAPPGTVIGHVHLHVGDLEGAEAFYHRALGLDKVVWSYPAALFLSAGGYHHHLGTNTWARGAPSASDEDARLIEWELVLPSAADIRLAGASISGGGYTIRPEDEDAVAADPWGTMLRLTRSDGTRIAP
jgi:catechol 2,3-dioxygenase